MNRIYTVLKCGCRISWDDGGALIPCENYSVCQSYNYCVEHKICGFCGQCLICVDNHGGCINE